MAVPLNDTPPRRTLESDLSPNRKLIRPSLADVRGPLASGPAGTVTARAMMATAAAPAPSLPPPSAPPRLARKPVPPDQTNAESFYFLKQMQSKTEMVLILRDGERVRGIIEWYDRHCIKVHRHGEPNLLIYKAIIKYIYKADEEAGDAS